MTTFNTISKGDVLRIAAGKAKQTLIAAVSISVAALMTVSSSAMDFISLAGGERRPSIDGAFEGEDLRLYQKIHDFYQPDAGE